MIRLLKIARREYVSYLRTPGFWISLCVAPLVLGFALMGGPKALQSAAPPPRLTVIDLTRSGFDRALQPTLSGEPPLAEIVAPPPASADAGSPEQAIAPLRAALSARGERALDLVVIISGVSTKARVDFWTRDPTTSSLAGLVERAVGDRMRQNRLIAAGLPSNLLKSVDAVQPEVRSFSPRARSERVSFRDQAPTLLALGLAFVLWMAVVTGAGILLNSVIEEKSGRILEVLMSCASIPEILGGKILGVAGLTGTVLAVWGALGLAAVSRTSPHLLGELGGALLSHGLIVWFVLFFAGGYLMYASIFAAIGAFCETSREAQTLLGPLMIVLSIPMVFLSLAQQRPDAPVIVILSWVPLFTPFLMIARIASGLPLWQVAGALLEMAATAAVIMWLCARAFRAGALSGGGKLDVKRLLAAFARPAET